MEPGYPTRSCRNDQRHPLLILDPRAAHHWMDGRYREPSNVLRYFQTQRYYCAQLNWIDQLARSSRYPRILSQRKTEQCSRRKSRTSKPKKNTARQRTSQSGLTTRSPTAIMMVIANRVSALIRYAGAFFGDFRRCVVFLPSRSGTVFMFLEIDPLHAMKSPPLCLAIVVGETWETNRVHIRLHPTPTPDFDELVTD